jgi:hypothetical protein
MAIVIVSCLRPKLRTANLHIFFSDCPFKCVDTSTLRPLEDIRPTLGPHLARAGVKLLLRKAMETVTLGVFCTHFLLRLAPTIKRTLSGRPFTDYG